MAGIARLLVTAAVVATMGVLTAPAGVADPLPYPDFLAARGAAVTASGVFTPGTTMTTDIVLYSGAELHVTANPDGSVVWLEQGSSGLYRMRCVRVDRCWEQSDVDFADVKWHRLPEGSVTYRQAAAGWTRATGADWPEGSVFDIATAPDGSTTFTASYSEQVDGEDYTTSEAITVRPMQVSEVVTLSGPMGDMQMRDLRMGAQTERVTVTAPTKRSIGTPAMELSDWTVDINR